MLLEYPTENSRLFRLIIIRIDKRSELRKEFIQKKIES